MAVVLASCAQTPPETEEVQQPSLVGSVALEQSASDTAPRRLLDVGIIIFDAAPVDEASAQLSEWLDTEIREKETHYLPYVLRNTLVQSNQWGAVRVLPEPDPSLDLEVYGTILRSDGVNLVLYVTARDSTGKTWLANTYADITGAEDFPNTVSAGAGRYSTVVESADPFQDLYAQIANDLLAVKRALAAPQQNTIKQVSLLRYARDLSPETFSRTLQEDDNGLLTAKALLAEDDPMTDRVADIKRRHYVFIDTVDDYYASLYEEMRPLYNLWRKYSREQIVDIRERNSLSAQGGNYGRSNFLAMSQRYNRYKWAKIYEQEFAALAQGFNNEIAPAILELNRQVHGLSGSVEEQYDQWRGILRELFEVETGGDLSVN
ncbi:MAG: hypothetical protein JKY98_11295 [Gammaproteobacteria bacterium]|nr:hypothetical protein [Gammaproteobacteria bacterium]